MHYRAAAFGAVKVKFLASLNARSDLTCKSILPFPNCFSLMLLQGKRTICTCGPAPSCSLSSSAAPFRRSSRSLTNSSRPCDRRTTPMRLHTPSGRGIAWGISRPSLEPARAPTRRCCVPRSSALTTWSIQCLRPESKKSPISGLRPSIDS
jgi:hypothetical protein